MKVIRKAKMYLANQMKLKLASISTNNGELFIDGEVSDITDWVGVEVYVLGDEGEYILPSDGEYEYENKVLVVKEGIVIEVRDESNSEPEIELEVGEAEEVPLPVNEVEEDSVPVSKFNELLEVVSDLVGEVKVLEGEVNQISTEFKAAMKMSRQEFIDNKPIVDGDNQRQSQLGKFGL